MTHLVYELSFKGAASATLVGAFADCDVASEHGTTTVRAELQDQAALHGIIGRIQGLGLDLLEVRLVAEGSDLDDWVGGPDVSA